MTIKPSAESEVELPPVTDDVFDNGNGNNGAASIHEDRACLKFDNMWESQRLLGWWLEQRERQLKAALRDKRAAEQYVKDWEETISIAGCVRDGSQPCGWRNKRADDLESKHAAIITLIDQTIACTSGMSHTDCLEEIKRRLK